uniref:Ig-like domain-containing protein n=1 Tax=Catagonus wagneri TaxID=51154 RepID=A0A8C3X832_9CETA
PLPWIPRCWLSLALSPVLTGPVEAGVTQSPSHRITETKKSLTLTCSQNMDHDAMYWYRQDPGLGLKLIYFSRSDPSVEKGDVPDGYSASREEKPNFSLTLESASANQTSLYLCASSVSTARFMLLYEALGTRQDTVFVPVSPPISSSYLTAFHSTAIRSPNTSFGDSVLGSHQAPLHHLGHPSSPPLPGNFWVFFFFFCLI